MANNATCPFCGGALPGDALGGGCPRCLAQVILNLPRSELHRAALTEGPGDQIGPYQLLERIGEGGCGVVYLAQQEKPLHRQVALKVIKEGMDTRQVIARFEAERQALAMMEHPNIAKVLDAGATQSGRPFFVMELVRGPRITDYCNQQQLGTEDRLRLFIQVCQAIQHAHQKGIIHRDIKPSNILVAVQDAVPTPKVIDFGIAKATEQRLTEKTLLTAFEQFIGTPAYMSPEQAELTTLDLDTRSDLYSLGVLLYELLTGQTPLDTRELFDSGLDEMLKMIREREPVRPSVKLSQTERAARKAGPSSKIHRPPSPIDPDLDWIVMKCLEKDRRRRYDTASGLAADLERHLSHEPVAARPPSALYRLQKAVRRHRFGFAAGTAVILALLIGAVLASWQAIRATRAAQALRLNAYAADMRAADAAVRQENLGQARQVLRSHIPKAGEIDLRGVEWRYLWQRAQGDKAVVFAHEGAVLSADVSPEGRWVAAVVDNGRGLVWDSASRRVAYDFSAMPPQRPVCRLVFHPSRPLLAVHYPDHLSVWNSETWTPVLEEALPTPARNVNVRAGMLTVGLCFSGDGSVLVRWHTGGIQAWKVDGWAPVVQAGEIPVPYSALAQLTVNRDGTECVEGSVYRRALRCWSLRSKTLAWEIPNVDQCWSVQLSPDDRQLVAGNALGQIRIWSLPDRREVLTYPAHQAQVYSLAFSPDGQWLASCGVDQDIRLWQSGTSSNVARFRGHAATPWGLRFSGDGQWLVSAAMDNTARLWRVANGTQQTNSFPVPKGRHLDPAITPGASYRTYNPTGRAFEINSVPDGRLLKSVALSPPMAPGRAGLLMTPGTLGLFGADDYGTLHRWDWTGKLVRTNSLGSDPTCPTLLSPSHRLLCAVQLLSNDVGMLVYDLAREQVLARFTNVSYGFHTAAAFSPDDTLFAHGEKGGYYTIWDLARQREVFRAKVTRATAGPAAFSPDGRLLATGNNENTVHVWDWRTGRLLYPPMIAHLAGVGKIQFSPDGRTLFTFGTDRTFRMWHVGTGREMVSSLPLNDTILFAPMLPTMTPDGNWLLEAASESRLRWAPLPSLAEIDASEKSSAN